jgi:RHS repeat-associated protein
VGFMYGRSHTRIEQVGSGGTVSYLHHDQAGSTRLLTGSTGTVTGKCTYSAYRTPTCEGTTTTPLGYDAQYTSTDTGLIYMRARVYDPATAQFPTRDPLEAITGEPYSYTADDPLNASDPSGLDFLEEGAEAVAGWGDTITFGVTKKIREGIGDEKRRYVLRCLPSWRIRWSCDRGADTWRGGGGDRCRGHLDQRQDRTTDGGSRMDRGVDSGGDRVGRSGPSSQQGDE